MSVRATDPIKPPVGMATAVPVSEVPPTHAQEVVGFTPARNGKLSLVPLLKRLQHSFGLTIHGHAIWQSNSGETDRLLIFSGTAIYSVLLYNAWKYDERGDGQHSYYQIASSLTSVGTAGGSAANGVVSIQFGQELIISVATILYRYYVDNDGVGTAHFFNLGLGVPNTFPSLAQGTGGSLTLLATYSYLVTLQDELSRESSPTASAAITLTGSNNKVSITFAGSYVPGGGETTWNIYRRNPGSAVFNFVTNLPLGTTIYNDTATDAVVNSGKSAPTAGENDPAGSLGPAFGATANIMTVWHDRLALNDITSPNTIQLSNAGSSTQFSSLALPTNLADGVRGKIGGKGQNEVTGLESLGDRLAVFGRSNISILYGDDSQSFVLQEVEQKGCQNPQSVQRTEAGVLFVSDDGVYMLGGDYLAKKVSGDVDNLFHGFTPTAQVGNATATGRLSSVQVANALNGAITSWYTDRRYFLSFGNRTLCMDVDTGGWTDTGYGFVKTATRYFSQMAALSGSAPETIFLTLGDQNNFGTELYYFTTADTPKDADAPGTVNSRLVTRPIGPPLANSKRPACIAVFGVCGARRAQKIGSVEWWGDGRLIGVSSLYAGITSRHKNALCESAAPLYTADVAWVALNFNLNDIAIENILVELSVLS